MNVLLLLPLLLPQSPITQTAHATKTVSGPVVKMRLGPTQTAQFTYQRPSWVLDFELNLSAVPLERVRLTMDGETTFTGVISTTPFGNVTIAGGFAMATIAPDQDLLLLLPHQLVLFAQGDPKGPRWQTFIVLASVASTRSVDIVDPSNLAWFEGVGTQTFQAAGGTSGVTVTCSGGNCSGQFTARQDLLVTVTYFEAP